MFLKSIEEVQIGERVKQMVEFNSKTRKTTWRYGKICKIIKTDNKTYDLIKVLFDNTHQTQDIYVFDLVKVDQNY